MGSKQNFQLRTRLHGNLLSCLEFHLSIHPHQHWMESAEGLQGPLQVWDSYKKEENQGRW